MSNHHQHANPPFRNPRQQHHNHIPYHQDRRPPHPNRLDSYSPRSDHHPPFAPLDQDFSYNRPPYNRRTGNHRQRRDSLGYGGTPSSDIPERATPLIGRDASPHSRRNRNTPPPYPPYRSDNYRNEPRDSDPSPSNPSVGGNTYTGGDPFTYPPPRITERNPTNRNANSQPQITSPHHEEPREASSLRNKGIVPTSGPVKSVYSSRSPVKPINSRLAPSSPVPSLAAKQTQPNDLRSIPRNPSATQDKPDNTYNSSRSTFRIESKTSLSERRNGRFLSCEKTAGPQNEFSLHSSGLRSGSAPLGCSAIAPPTRIPSADVTQNRTEQQNASYSQSNEESVETTENTEQKNMEVSDTANRHQNQKRRSVERIFRRSSGRVPDLPDDNVSEWSAPVHCQKNSPSSAQSREEVKEVVTSSDAREKQFKLPSLLSVPAPVRSSTVDDTPRRRAAVAALLRAGQVDCEEVKLVKSCEPSRSNSSHKDAALSESELQEATDNAKKEGMAARRNPATSASEPRSVDQRMAHSNTERDGKLEVDDLDNRHRGHVNQPTQNFVGEGEKQGVRSTKRRVIDLEESKRLAAKRSRPASSPEAVNVEDNLVVRQSQRFQKRKTDKTWEITKFEPDRVQNLFHTQLRAQPMLLRISFLGISDGDLRTTLDIYKSGTDLPEPDYRSLEVNNNRIRCITNEICTSISALRVTSLNLSCNMLTTLGDKLGLCSKLKFLNLSRNRISCLPQELCDLTNLEVLNLSGNNIARLPSGLCRLKKLEILSLARNKLEVLPEDIAGEGAALTGLDIAHNHRFHFFPRCTEHWTKLLVLHMSDTEMYRSLSRRDHRLRPSALLKELAGRNQDMRAARRAALRSQNAMTRR